MSRTVISGLVCITFLMLLEFSAVPQEPARKGADTESGQLTFNNACRTCHTTKEGDNRLGPNLHNVIGRKAGSLPSYGYSSAMKGADFVWDKEKLDRFIAKPDEVVPGNNEESLASNMLFYGAETRVTNVSDMVWCCFPFCFKRPT